ncbi:leukotriene C4 synthase-like isoform X1 [Ciconia boyciana]|uniref:leukotriene C4 synthase-like isoform X1 n=1 Tax=Ciconia boyciana TaxID=52775 RepID=UPI003B9DE804
MSALQEQTCAASYHCQLPHQQGLNLARGGSDQGIGFSRIWKSQYVGSDSSAGCCDSPGSPGARVNSSEYFPIFLALLWQAGLFFHQGLAAALGLLYLYARYCYFMGYKASSSERLAPIYFSTGVLWILVAASALGILHFFLSHYVGLNILQLLTA